MAETSTHFDDGAGYERFMGRWSRAVGTTFLAWLAPPQGARWLDVGCGTGAFTELVLDTCAPSAVTGVDPAAGQIDYVRRQPLARRAEFRLADGQTLPFPDDSFDVVASAFVINFMPEPATALAEMRRVARPGGMVAGCVWDFAGDRGPSEPLRAAMRAVGVEARAQAGIECTPLPALHALFASTGFDEVATRAIDVSLAFPSFDELWRSQTPPLHPNAKAIAALPEQDRARLIELVRASLPPRPDGTIAYSACAHAIKARVPA